MKTHVRSSTAAVVAVRLVLLVLAAAALVAALAAARARDSARDPSTVHYVCPMHPQVTSPSPGDCPICRMALEPAARPQPAAPTAHDALLLPADSELRRFHAVARVKRFRTALEMRAPAWIDGADTGLALLHLDEQQELVPGETGLFLAATRPRDGDPAGIAVRATADPPQRWDDATALVRFRAERGARLSPGQTGTIKFRGRLRDGLVVRQAALLDSPAGPYVLVVSEDRRTVTPRRVVIGNVHHGYGALISGLTENELVVAQRAFFLDSERRLAAGAR